MTEREPLCEAERRLGLSYINIASHGVKEHLGRMVAEDVALVLFDRRGSSESIASLWRIDKGEAITSMPLPFPLGMLWDWDWRAQTVETVFEELREMVNACAPQTSDTNLLKA